MKDNFGNIKVYAPRLKPVCARANWRSLDTGVRYRSDFHGIGDAQIEAGLNFGFSGRDFARAK